MAVAPHATVWATLTQNLTPVAAGIFGGYLAITALLITLAITRHDNLIPLSRAIAGPYHRFFTAWEIMSLVSAVIAGIIANTITIWGALIGQVVSLSIIIALLWKAVGTAINPRRYELIALQLAKKEVKWRIRIAFTARSVKKSKVSIRGKMPIESLQNANPRLKRVLSKREGLVLYRHAWLRWMERSQVGLQYPNTSWLAQDSGSPVRIGDALRIAIPHTFHNWLGAAAVRIIPFDIDYWNDLTLMATTSYFSSDRLAYERAVELFLTAIRILGEINNGKGATYGDMWPELGCHEAFQIGLRFEDLVKSIVRSNTVSGKHDAGKLILRMIGITIERETAAQPVRFILDKLKSESVAFSGEDLGYLILRQNFFTLENIIPVWAALIKYWISTPSVTIEVVEWLNSSKITTSTLKEGGVLMGAMIILSVGQGSSQLCDTFISDSARQLAVRIQAEMPK